VLLYDRANGFLVRVARWQGEIGPRWEHWSGVSDAAILKDSPEDGFGTGAYSSDSSEPSEVPEATRREALRSLE
jgi:hypothetical protein